MEECFALLGTPPLAGSLNSTFPALKSVTIHPIHYFQKVVIIAAVASSSRHFVLVRRVYVF